MACVIFRLGWRFAGTIGYKSNGIPRTLAGMVISLVIWSGVGVIVAMAAALSINGVFGVIVDTARSRQFRAVNAAWSNERWALHKQTLPKCGNAAAIFGFFFTDMSVIGGSTDQMEPGIRNECVIWSAFVCGDWVYGCVIGVRVGVNVVVTIFFICLIGAIG